MSKLTYEDKKEIVRLYKESGYGSCKLGRMYGVDSSTILRLVKRYEAWGDEALEKKKYQAYPQSLKMEVAQRILNGESYASLEPEYNIRASTIRQWVQKFEESGYDGLEDKKKGRPAMKKETCKPSDPAIEEIDPSDKDALIESLERKVKEQEEEIRYKELEIEALKKLRALVLQRNARQTGKKR